MSDLEQIGYSSGIAAVAPASPLRVRFVEQCGEEFAVDSGEHVLAAVRYETRSAAVVHDAALTIVAPLRQLADRPRLELWTSPSRPTPITRGGISAARTDDAVFGGVVLEGQGLESTVRSAYREILHFVEDVGLPHLSRIWCVLPDINGRRGVLDRYKVFCRGRARAFLEHYGEGFESRLCASSAVGSHRGQPLIYFLAGRAAGVHRENPRQIAAYRYPQCHGPSSPSFARATQAWSSVFLSGTASIVGHSTRHPGDVRTQLRETLRNVRSLLQDFPPTHDAVLLKVYVRHAPALPGIREQIRKLVDFPCATVFLEADICRPELTLEIEGVAAGVGAGAPIR